jgi:hypothetical protein
MLWSVMEPYVDMSWYVFMFGTKHIDNVYFLHFAFGHIHNKKVMRMQLVLVCQSVHSHVYNNSKIAQHIFMKFDIGEFY